MTDLQDDLARLEGTIAGLESSVTNADSVTTAFRAEMEEVTGAMRTATSDATSLSRSLGTSLKGAMNDLILDGAKLSDVLGGVGRSISSSVLNSALQPVTEAVSGAVTGLFGGYFAKGGSFSSGRVEPFATGGVVTGPTRFPMRGGRVGLMGEAGPEAIMPLSRGPDGKLGIRAGGGGGTINVSMNISTPDVDGFRRSQSQVAAQLSRALSRGQRNS